MNDMNKKQVEYQGDEEESYLYNDDEKRILSIGK